MFCSLVFVSFLASWSLWPWFLAACVTSDPVGISVQFGDWVSGGLLGLGYSRGSLSDLGVGIR